MYDVRLLNAASPDGFNKAHINHGSSNTQDTFWYEDPSTVSAPVISFSGITEPASPTLSYSSGIAHYTESSNNTFTYVLTVTNASGDMYTSSTLLSSDGNGNAFASPGNKSYTDFTGGTNPPVRNYGVGTGVTCLISNVPRNLHTTVTTNKFTRYDATTPYGSHNNQRINYTPTINLMGTSATTSQVDEDNILISSLGTGSGNAIRVNAGASGDTPSPISSTFNSSATPATYEAAVRGGTLRHDQEDYSDGSFMPVGIDLSSGRSGTQYFQVLLTRGAVSEFKIVVTGSYSGCFVCLPENSTWTTGLSNTNGWADMSNAYSGAGNPNNADNGCALGSVMSGSGGTFTCVFGEESSSNGNNKILVRFKLTSGDSITNIQFQAT